ncbi:MAS1 proto-oncogene like, G protein-coupled receptor [Chelydra serpentina]|uniref:MAS1 proto-oncogene like, G protein-coupled receptor n=1 Tax=Chelydra serpentina TaxID=8475 RepID=A0A8T1RYP0_CHESE|nr:MAS1 proto-oncogene like, G protein-coupled receptor [Chelydra serpentina]
MVLSSLTLFIKVRHSSQQRQPGKLYTVILLTILFFLLFAVPLSLHIVLVYCNVYDSSVIPYKLASVNSSISQVIYFIVGSYRKQRFRGSIKVTLQRVFEEKADPREDGETTEQTQWRWPIKSLQHPACSGAGEFPRSKKLEMEAAH